MFLWGYAIVITKKTGANTFQINYILGLVLLISGGVCYPYVESKATALELVTALFVTGLPLVFGQLLFIGSLTMTKDTGVLNMVNFWSIFVGYLVSIFRYKETPNIPTTIGVVLVFWGVWKTIFSKDKA